MNEQIISEAIAALIEDHGIKNPAPLARAIKQTVTLEEVMTFKEAGLMTRNAGVKLRMSDGREFQITVVQSYAGQEHVAEGPDVIQQGIIDSFSKK